MFREQGTSASHLAAAQFLDAIARMNGNDGQNSDAMSAYTQVEHKGVDTWFFIHKDRQPKKLGQIQKPSLQAKA